MSSVRTMEIEKVGAPIVVATMVLTFGTMAFLLVREASGPLDITAPAAVPSYQAAEDQVPSLAAAPQQGPGDASAVAMAAAVDTAVPETSVAPAPRAPREREGSSPGTSEQRAYRSRRALETVDARELLRQANMPR
ncbi:MAG TPA: hypothetical protein VFP65_06610 [Anaeromyxobacteraceae bacterium]|nr:hypothetical protein [Anaeromyxobacteraceae bacterium]